MSAPVIGITTGDPGGVGPEIVVKALANRATRQGIRPVVIGDRTVIEEAIAGCDLALDVAPIEAPGDATGQPGLLEIIDTAKISAPVEFGCVRADYGAAAVTYITRAVELARAGQLDSIVTGPINKQSLRATSSPFPGHTEMLASLFNVELSQVMTMFTVARMRIFFLTRHHSLRNAIDLLDAEMVYAGIVRVNEVMADIGAPQPRIALAALNPHAGEHGLMGTEEDEILTPAVERARNAGVDVVGPVPADAVFAHCRAGRYACVLSLYHDQGHVAAKTLDFFGTVSSTLGLPIIRTAAEHGTAFDIAGKWIADPDGQIAAMAQAAELGPTYVAGGSSAGGRG
jgi:4-hydroxythreonine-4-phosphate dehydrogenase